MIQKRNITESMVELSCESGYLHREGSDVYVTRVAVRAADADKYEWVAEKPTYTRSEYESEVERLIREQYSVSAELAILRQRDDKAEEFAQYNAYAEECKLRAKEILSNRKEE